MGRYLLLAFLVPAFLLFGLWSFRSLGVLNKLFYAYVNGWVSWPGPQVDFLDREGDRRPRPDWLPPVYLFKAYRNHVMGVLLVWCWIGLELDSVWKGAPFFAAWLPEWLAFALPVFLIPFSGLVFLFPVSKLISLVKAELDPR